jgi:hypothetical protein
VTEENQTAFEHMLYIGTTYGDVIELMRRAGVIQTLTLGVGGGFS